MFAFRVADGTCREYGSSDDRLSGHADRFLNRLQEVIRPEGLV
jgi:hypothetical protein